MTVKKKLEIFEKVNRGEVRVILGSTFTLGTGVNIQERLHTLIHLDAPNRPMDYTQRNGRILRQGNLHKDMNKPVRILRFGVEDSLDVTAYQRLKTKGAIADSIMNGKQMMSNSMTNRVLEEEEDVFGDTIAQLSGSEYAMLKNNAEKNVRKYASRKKQWETDQAYIHNAKPRLKAFIKDAEKRVEDNSRSLEAVRASFPDEQFKEIVIGKHRFTSVDTMDDFFKEHNKTVLAEMKQMKDGDIAGEQKRELTIQIGNFPFIVTTKLTRQTMRDGTTLFNDVERKMTYSCTELGIEDVPVRQNLLRNAIEDITGNVITGKNFAERLEAAERSKKHNETELKELLSREGKPFEYEEELAQAKSQLEEYAELMKKELEEKEAKYAEMDATVETANNVSTSEEDDELKREDDGAYTDDEVSYDNDSVAKLLGQSRRTAKQRRKFAQRERQRMAERVVSLTEKLHLDNVEVVTDASTLDGKKQRAKGFYSKSTGKITIVIPNHTSMFDVEQTLLHEAVAHYGLRQLFGEHFDTFLDNVFNNADEIIRRRIVDMASKNGWDFRKATEEYLAGLAEHINFEEARKNGWWQRIKQFFFEMLDKLGFSDFRGVTLTDNELRYILWRSYENLKEGKHSNLFGEAADIAMQHKLRVGEFADTSTDDVLNRDGDPEIHERTLARAKYEQRVKSGMYQSQEALQDSMLGLKEAMTAILGKNTRMEDVDGFENAYLGENRLSSVNKAEADAFAHLLFKPMLEEVAKLAHNTAEREELTDYMMAKHGLERNRVMAERDAQKDFAEYQKQHPKSTKTLQDFIDECRKRDYAGLTALTGMEEIVDAEAEAQVMVDEYENAHDTTALWSKVNAVSKAVLSKSYECGMMSKETYDSVRDMYEFYIPLRGFDEKTSSEAYAYLTHKQSLFNAPIKKAEGRRSKADDPFANLQSMAESAIMQGNRNKLVKQKFLNFALNHPSDLVSVSDLWLQYDAVADEWKPIFPDNIDINDSPEEVERKMNEFEDKMKQLAESAPDNYKHGKDAVNIPYRVVENRNLRQHQVVVKRNGRDYVITINGNPRAAQALNGQTNPDNDISGSIGQLVHLIGDVNRTLSSLYTTLQPDFIASNFLRDMVYSNSMVWVKESPKYAIQYNMNFAKLPIVRMVMLLDKYRRGTLDMNDEIEKMFYQFMMNGGETGFSRMADIDEHKKEIKKMLKAANEKIPAHVVRECMATWIGEVGRGIEMRARFAAFVTSRNAGRTIDRSIWDAKEISVNFNKKGAGDKFLGAEGQTMLGNVAAGVSGAGRAGYIFWNAALQGTFGNFLKYAMRHPGKMGTVVASWYGLAMLVTALASAGGDDDDDSYYDIPEHTRRQNLIVKGPGNAWIKIPLPIEYRAVYAMGELTGSSLFHNEKLEVSDVLAQMSQLLPVDMMEGTKALWPSSVKPMVEVSNNESWYGSPIWKDTPYNKYMPNWTKAYKSANKDLVNLSETLNEVSGGSKYRKGTIDLNPAAIEYLLKQYTGGFFTVTNQIRNLINVGTGEKDFDWRYVPLANRMLMSGGDERNVGRGLDEKFFGYLDAYRAKASEFSAIKGDLSLPLEKKAELISEIIIDPEYVKMKEMERIYSKLKKAYDTAKEIGDTSKAEELEKRINELKRTFILEMEQDERK
ncbi:helicase-related protein [Bacteroides ovatus]|nr:helicase-related protein [Bacteroides ovatus]